MKVLMINGSRREHCCTYTALSIIGDSLKEEGIDAEIVFVGRDAVNGNLDALIKSLGEKCDEADGFVFGSPVYYASLTGEIKLVLDHLFGSHRDKMRCKPAAIVAFARRAGTTATLDVLAKYPAINEMPIVSSSYWPMVHGNTPEDIMKDEEGVGIMRQLGKNMAWMLKCITAGRAAGIDAPNPPDYHKTNFIR